MIERKKQDVAITSVQTAGQLRKKEQDLNSISRRSLLEIILFFLISIGAFQLRGFDLLTSVSQPVRELLGYPPPAYLVTIALAAYCFSALTIVLTQLSSDVEPRPQWSHLGYRTTFYLFYAVSGSLATHYMAVFFIGFFLYGVEQIHIWIYSNRFDHQEEELLGER